MQVNRIPFSITMFRFVTLIIAFANIAWGASQDGVINPNLDGRIVGGTNTTIEEHPYIVSILEDGNHVCGGSIISQDWIVSAAHCFIGTVSRYSIRTGSTIRNSGGQVIAAGRIIIHASYSGFDYDIALIQLESPITNPIAHAIVMADEDGIPEAGTTATITGWGALYEGGPMADILQVVHVPIISQESCRAAYGGLITDRMLCAGLLGVGGRDACQNDSGGPLLANGVLTGIVSFGSGCARPNSPGVYASVPNLRAWIRTHTSH